MTDYEEEIGLWNGIPPFAQPDDQKLHEHFLPDQNDGIERLTDVIRPTMTFYPYTSGEPLEQRKSPAVLVCPGGGYSTLAWDKEGRDICFLLNRFGFSAFLLKYRCPDRRTAARADAARAIRLIRANAQKFCIDPEKIGAIGFSAGAHLCASITAPADDLPYPPQDDADKLRYRPDFTALIYPAYLADNDLKLAPEFKIDEKCPPCLIVQSEDDPVCVENAVAWFMGMKRAGRPADLHIWPTGGHGYGLIIQNKPTDCWGEIAGKWFRCQL